MDLIKAITLKIENETFNNEIDGYAQKDVFYQLKLLIDANFIAGKYYYDSEGSKRFVNGAIVNDLTWEGHNLLDILKDDNKFKVIKDLAKNLSMDTLKFVLNQAIQGAIQ